MHSITQTQTSRNRNTNTNTDATRSEQESPASHVHGLGSVSMKKAHGIKHCVEIVVVFPFLWTVVLLNGAPAHHMRTVQLFFLLFDAILLLLLFARVFDVVVIVSVSIFFLIPIFYLRLPPSMSVEEIFAYWMGSVAASYSMLDT